MKQLNISEQWRELNKKLDEYIEMCALEKVFGINNNNYFSENNLKTEVVK